jgi:hypothetical protein
VVPIAGAKEIVSDSGNPSAEKEPRLVGQHRGNADYPESGSKVDA